MNSDRLIAVAGSVVVHLLLLGILAFTLWERPEPPKMAAHKPIIQATAVDEATAMAPVRRREAEEQHKREEAERQRQAEERKKAEAEKKRRAELKRKKAEAEKQRQAEIKRKKVEAEKQRIAEEKRKKAEAEKQRRAEELRKKEEAERQRKEQEDIERRKAELQRQMDIEAERLAAEERAQSAQQLALDRAEYLNAIVRVVKREWQRPPGSSKDFLCKVLVKQIPSGDVIDVRVIKSSGNVMIDRSVEMAVRKASPLPLPANRELFDRDLVITFVPE